MAKRRSHSWAIEDHVCRICFSRILSMPAEGRGRIYRCAGCGEQATSANPSSICACGIKLKNGRDLGVRCVVNDAPSPEAPAEIVARQVVA